ncbi:MAG: methylated-DNA--[protein]-cysteine S-methyltransferase [Pseudomonadota bacterium]
MAETTDSIHFSLFPTSLGECGIAWRGETVIATSLPEKSPQETARRLAAQTCGTEADPSPAIQRAIEAITTLLEGENTDLTFIDCDFSGLDDFAEKVYELALTIPPGETLTYGDIASELGDKQLSRSVGQALGRNPFPIIVPCHRVMGAGGKLTGFSANGGVSTKLKMLEIEGAEVAGPPSLFDDLPLAVKPG